MTRGEWMNQRARLGRDIMDMRRRLAEPIDKKNRAVDEHARERTTARLAAAEADLAALGPEPDADASPDITPAIRARVMAEAAEIARECSRRLRAD